MRRAGSAARAASRGLTAASRGPGRGASRGLTAASPVVLRRSGKIATMTPAAERRLPPAGLLVFLAYALLVLAIIGISLPWVVDQAISAPLSIPGIAAMVLLAYTIFTITLVLQRKQAARGLALGLSTLTIPAVALLLLGPVPAVALVPAGLAVLLFVGLTRPSVRAWLTEE